MEWKREKEGEEDAEEEEEEEEGAEKEKYCWELEKAFSEEIAAVEGLTQNWKTERWL